MRAARGALPSTRKPLKRLDLNLIKGGSAYIVRQFNFERNKLMTDIIFKLFVKSYRESEDKNAAFADPAVRRACGSTVAAVGIFTNLLLAAIKFFAGILSGAISITADAANNLSDAGSQIVSLISFKISAKPADRDHPFGHARIEYVASMIVSFLVLFVGIQLLTDSVDKIFNPTESRYSLLVLIILGISVVAKLGLFLFGRSAAKTLKSDVIRATATDSLSDAGATLAVLVCAIISKFTGFDIDGYIGTLVAVVILIAGVKILNDTKNSILGSAPEPEVVENITQIVEEYPEILGIHDLVVHNYGPGNTIASLHAEVDGKENVFATHDIIDTVEKRLYVEMGVRTTIHMDPIVTDDERVSALREEVRAKLKEVDARFGMHDFRFVEGITHSNLIFDVTVPFEVKDSNERIKEQISSKISEISPNYFTVLTIDRE